MPAMEVVNGFAVNPGATVTALTPCTGNSFTVRNTNQPGAAYIAEAWAYDTTNLLFRVRSPLLHDVAQNLRMKPTASQPTPLLSGYGLQKLQPQDNLIVEMSGGTAETDLGGLLLYYDVLPGVGAARLHSWSEVQPLIEQFTTIEVDLTSSATAGQYSAAVSLNSSFDTLKRGYDYAILGYESTLNGGSVGITGVDTGNLRVGGPLTALSFLTRNWFIEQSNKTGKSMIPVINASNVAGINIDITSASASTAYQIGFVLAQLGESGQLS